MSSKKLDYNQIIKLQGEGKTDPEIARAMNASVNGIRHARGTVLGLPRNPEKTPKDYTITKDMEELLVGTLLGDACVYYVYSGATAPKFSTCHSVKQEQYVLNIYNKLLPIMSKNIEYSDAKAGFKGKNYQSTRAIHINSHNVADLIEYRKVFYPNGKKIIPVDWIRDKFTALSLAYWYMDDGSLDRNGHSYIINTQCFTKKNLEEWTAFLLEKFNLEFSIKKDCSLYLRHKSNETFENLIRGYLTEDMQYKLSRPKTPLNGETPASQDNPVLSLQETGENA